MSLNNFLIFTFLIFTFNLFSYTKDTLDNRYKSIENFYENIEIEEGGEDIFNLEELQNLRININSALSEDLSKLPFLNSYQIENILKYRIKNGLFISFWEFLEIEGVDKNLLEQIKAFCIIDFPERKVKYFNKVSNKILFRSRFLLENREGVSNGKYTGDKYKTFLRYTFSGSENLRFGITSEKDEYENFFSKNNPYGFDFYSSFIEIKKIKNHIDIYVGDFHTEFGQGVVLWSGYRINKSLDDIILTSSKGFKPHRGVEENRFFRGIASKINYKKWNLYLMASYRNIDGNLENDTIKSLLYTGFHRTKNEISKENNIYKTDFASSLEYKDIGVNFGILTNYTKFDKAIFPNYQLYNHHTFLGKENISSSLYYSFRVNKFEFFGEEAISNGNSFSVYNGIFFYPITEYKFLVSHRYIDKKYNSFYNSPFVSSPNSTEEGIFFNIKANPFSKISIVAFLDYYKYNWLKFGLNSLSWGSNSACQIKYKINNFSFITFRYSNKDIPSNYTENNISINKFENRKNFRFQIDIDKEFIYFRTRVENLIYKDYLENEQKGFLIYQNVKFYIPNYENIKFYIRYTLFNSQNWNSRIYAYEDDFIGIFNTNLHYRRGNRYYFMVKYKINNFITFWSRISQTIYINETSISSGDDLIKGNKQTELKFQLNIKI